MEEMSTGGTRVRGIDCTLLPGEEVVFSVYEGPSVAAVRELDERADIPISRNHRGDCGDVQPGRLTHRMRNRY